MPGATPHDLAGLVRTAAEALPARLAQGGPGPTASTTRAASPRLAWAMLADDPAEVVAALDAAVEAGATPEELGRALAYAAALRITRFHTQNDHGDWDEVHHAFTAANALHQATRCAPTPELLRGVYHGALRVYLDRFLNVPAARLPVATASRPATSPSWRRAGTSRAASTTPGPSSTAG